MKVILLNGSRKEKGCTYTALSELADTLSEESIDSEIIWVGNANDLGNIDETVAKVAEEAKNADGIVIGSPVYYASPTGEIIAFLDRLYSVAGKDLKFKPGASVVSARRGGTTSSFEVLNKYLQINQQPVVSSNYWNQVHGNTPEEVAKDEEGLQTIRTLARNFAWLLKCIEAGKQNGIVRPNEEERLRTNFIR